MAGLLRWRTGTLKTRTPAGRSVTSWTPVSAEHTTSISNPRPASSSRLRRTCMCSAGECWVTISTLGARLPSGSGAISATPAPRGGDGRLVRPRLLLAAVENGAELQEGQRTFPSERLGQLPAPGAELIALVESLSKRRGHIFGPVGSEQRRRPKPASQAGQVGEHEWTAEPDRLEGGPVHDPRAG